MKLYPCAWYAICECGENLESEDGSMMLTREDFRNGPAVLTCLVCGKKHKVPERVK